MADTTESCNLIPQAQLANSPVWERLSYHWPDQSGVAELARLQQRNAEDEAAR
jgi:hypothetical protein